MRKIAFIFILFLCSSCNKKSFNPDLVSVVTGHKLATEAAYKVLMEGGAAADALVTAALMLSNVEAQSSGLGGGFLAVYYDASLDKVFSIDAREKAASKVDPKVFLDENDKVINFVPERLSTGAAVGIPGMAAGLDLLHSRFGSFSRERLLKPVIDVAENGFIINDRFARLAQMDAEISLKRLKKSRLSLFPATRKLLFKDDELIKEGDVLINKDYAKALRLLSEKGFQDFYTGDIAKAIVKLINNPKPGDYDSEVDFNLKPSHLSLEDFRNYQAVFREPIKFNWKASRYEEPITVYSMGPPSSGGTAIAQILNLIDNPNTTDKEIDFYNLEVKDRLLILSEAYKLAFKDRNAFLGDEDFIPDLKEIKDALIQPAYVDKLRDAYLTEPFKANHELKLNHAELLEKIIQAEKPEFKLSNKCHESEFIPEHGTSHLAISDAYGNVLSATLTIEWIFGNGMVVPGYGFFLNNELTDFDPQPGRCNSIVANKRPRSSMSPTIVMHKNKPIFAVGASGGWTIIGSTLQVLLNFFEQKLSLTKAIEAPRIYNPNNGSLYLEEEFFQDEKLLAFLSERLTAKPLAPLQPTKPEIKLISKFRTRAQALYIDQQQGKAFAAADKRGQGFAVNN